MMPPFTPPLVDSFADSFQSLPPLDMPMYIVNRREAKKSIPARPFGSFRFIVGLCLLAMRPDRSEEVHKMAAIIPPDLHSTPYIITHTNVNMLATAGPHHVHAPADRKTEQFGVCGYANLVRVTFNGNPAGDTYYLPFTANNMHSMQLPANPGFNAVFITANLDGCWMFVDRKNNGNVVVYHANASGPTYSPTAQQSATTPLYQTPAALGQLNNLYNAASPYYNGTPTTNHYVLRKDRYLREVNNRLARKAAQGRTGVTYAVPEHGSYTTFVGFYIGGHWEFWFQTFSQFIYKRPRAHIKSLFGHREVKPDVSYDPYEIVEATRWLVVP